MSSKYNKPHCKIKFNIKTLLDSTLDDSNASKNTNTTAPTNKLTVIDLDRNDKISKKKYTHLKGIIFDSILDIKLFNDNFFFLMKYRIDDNNNCYSKKWFKNIDD